MASITYNRLLTRNSPGFSTWISLNTRQERTDYSNEGVLPVPHAYIPNQILPSRLWQVQSYAVHCMLPVPWTSIGTDLFSSFIRTGGSTGIMGASAGLAVVEMGMNEPSGTSFGIGRKFKAGIEIGHCVGDKYWEKLYVASIITRTSAFGQDILNHTTFQDVFQRSRLKRMYVNHGIVWGYKIENDKHILRLDIDGSLPEERSESFKVTIKGLDSDIIVDVVTILTNYDMVIKAPEEPINIKVGSFYTLDTVLCLRDPYLLAGFYFGTEDEGMQREFNSGLNVHGTSNNNFYYEVDFVGTYILKGVAEEGAEEGAVIDSSGEFSDNDNFKWHWIKNDREIESDIYFNEVDRYGEYSDFVTEEIDGVDAEINVSRKVKREIGMQVDIDELIEMEAKSIRMEINYGGSSGRNNWHSPVLAKNWFKQGENYFQILNQPDGNVIDISLKDVTGIHDLDLNSGGSIFNHYGWFIVEHYMGEAQNGFFGGGSRVQVVSSSEIESEIKIEETYLLRGTLYENVPKQFYNSEMGINSFYNRFKKDTAENGGTKKIWEKYDGWKLVTQSGKSFNIKSIDFPSDIGDDPLSEELRMFDVTVTVEGDASSLDQATWVCFDTPYTRLSSSVKTGFLFADYQQGAESGSATLCADITYTSVPVKIDIQKNTIVGVCSGRWMGLGLYGSYYVTSNNGLPLIVRTSAGMNSISSFYDPIAQTNWVIYKDPFTNKLTVRTGQLDFREYPRKIEISYGAEEAVESTSFPIILNEDYDRTKLITMKMGNDAGGGANLFTIGSENDYHGFLVKGDGEMDFQVLRILEKKPGTVSVDKYKFREYFSSPVYLYDRNDIDKREHNTLFIGASTSDGPIFHEGANVPSEVNIHYIKNYQTLENARFDAHHMNDSEIILVYAYRTFPFSCEGTKYNDFIGDPESAWKEQNSLFLLSTFDDLYTWRCPMSKNENAKKYQQPLMILNGVDYKCSIYNKISSQMHFICMHVTDSGAYYLGCFNVSITKMLNKTHECTIGDEGNGFLWRPPLLEATESWSPDKIEIATSSAPTAPTAPTDPFKYQDGFYRIVGHEGTDSFIIDDEVTLLNISGSRIDKYGILSVLYDYKKNIQILFSTTAGRKWHKSEIIFAKEATSALVIEDLLFYIDSEGIKLKVINSLDWDSAYKSVAGIEPDVIEKVQERFDEAIVIPLGSGQIDEQRLSGYKTSNDLYYIFYYSNNGELSSLRGDGIYKWSSSPNF
jgi:hypothetical protein